LTEEAHIDFSSKLICLKSLTDKIDFHDFQLKTAIRVLDSLSSRAILADEVGLGKTIEAGLIVKELILRGSIVNILILVPKALEFQWQIELSQKFEESFSRFSDVARVRIEDPNITMKLIAGHAQMSRKDTYNLLNARKWDIVVVDEAHRFGNSSSNMSQNLLRLQKERILLLTATPLQNSLSELFQLIKIARPDVLPNEYRWEDFVMDERGRLIRESRLKDLRRIISEILCRTRRSDTGIAFVERKVSSISIEPTPKEKVLIVAANDIFSRMWEYSKGSGSGGLARLSLLQGLSSHPKAFEESLLRVQIDEKDISDRIDDIRKMVNLIESSSKELALFDFLNRTKPTQAVIFVERLATGKRLEDVLSSKYGSTVFYHGGLSSISRQSMVERFQKGNVQFFVSTTAGSEGLNLQNSSVLVNFDLHWNPLKLEQRIGRVHRFGQKNPVTVLNLSTKGTVDDMIRYIIFDKIGLFKMAIGEIDTIVSEFGEDVDFESKIIKIVRSSKDLFEMEINLTLLGDDIAQKVAGYNESMNLSRTVLEEL